MNYLKWLAGYLALMVGVAFLVTHHVGIFLALSAVGLVALYVSSALASES